MENFLGILVECLQDLFFWRGVVTGAVALLVLWCVIRLLLSCRHTLKQIVVSEEGGQFVISKKALHEFLCGVIAGVDGVELLDVILIKRSAGKVRVDLKLSLAPNGNFQAVHDTLRQRVLSEGQSKLMLGDRIESVNLFFEKMPPSTQVEGLAQSDKNA